MSGGELQPGRGNALELFEVRLLLGKFLLKVDQAVDKLVKKALARVLPRDFEFSVWANFQDINQARRAIDVLLLESAHRYIVKLFGHYVSDACLHEGPGELAEHLLLVVFLGID